MSEIQNTICAHFRKILSGLRGFYTDMGGMSGHSYALEKRSDAGKRLLQTVSAQKTA
ncbi:hypothetical protein M068_3791 [Bacteroides fragilis str. J38-1]|nr:hypothetical protein M068_3791 [Bacteroides fragilis str. J38-1]